MKPEELAITDIPLKTSSGMNNSRNLTEGSIVKNLLYLSWPMIISDTLNTIGPTIDMLWLGRIGASSIAGVGIAGMVQIIMMLGMWGLNTGLKAMITRAIGAGDFETPIDIARQAMVVGFIYTASIGIVIFFFAESLLGLTGVEPDVIREGAAYIRIIMIAMIGVSLHMSIEGFMQACGDAVNPMKISIFMRITHVVLAPGLIFGWWIFPRLEVRGAALAQVLSMVVAVGIGLFYVFSGRTAIRLNMRNFRIDSGTMWRLLKIGIPASLNGLQKRLGRFVLMLFIVPFGTIPVAAYTLIERIEMFISTPCFGLARASSILVGQNLGALKPERSEKSAWTALGFAESVVIIFSVLIFLWPETTARIFSSDLKLIETTSAYLRVVVIGLITIGFEKVFMESLAGAGDTMAAMIINLASTWLITIPLSYILTRYTGLGVFGIWWAIVAGLLLGSSAYLIYFWNGKWKHKKI